MKKYSNILILLAGLLMVAGCQKQYPPFVHEEWQKYMWDNKKVGRWCREDANAVMWAMLDIEFVLIDLDSYLIRYDYPDCGYFRYPDDRQNEVALKIDKHLEKIRQECRAITEIAYSVEESGFSKVIK